MRYFTRGWANGDLDDPEWERALADYQARLEEIGGRLSFAVDELARRTNLHDALIDSVRWEMATGRLTLKLVHHHLDTDEHRLLTLVYEGAMLGAARVESLRRAALSRDTELLYDEVDFDEKDGLFVHRILFWPNEELTIEFRSLTLSSQPIPNRRVELSNAFYEWEPDGDE
ncbi:MAG TPA: hypothetical protein VL916_18415 [Ilumatobacteraceae bacterium]|nr:hypothetical protein [Ilumatobacteraceae bacterium]